jgi:hypothetical protein
MKTRNGIFTKVNPDFRFSEQYGGGASYSIFDTTGKYFILFAFCTCLGCRKPYDPPAINAPNGYLVVEGIINPGSDSTSITLSRTVNISSNITINPVTGAIVSVLRDDNVAYPLTEAGNGTYISAGLNLDNSHQYKLSIKTSDGKQYQSDAEPVLITPPIDSIGYNIVAGPDTGVQVYANTHDPTGATKYYRWDYTENWQFVSKYASPDIATGGTIVPRTGGQLISLCYSSDVSSDIVLGSSAKLSQAVISHSPIAFIQSTSEKLEDRYRIQVNQYALGSNAYSFWLNLRKNTEQLGSIFDAQPSQVPGNIHCLTNPTEPVVGYISVCTVTTKTLFIYTSNLPSWVPAYPYTCNLDTAKVGTQTYQDVLNYPSIYYIVGAVGSNNFNPTGYLYTDRQCADCTIRGTVTPPPFWR